jgi:hypothetical protein
MKVLITVFIVMVAVYLFLQVAGVYDRSVNPKHQSGDSAPAATGAPASGEALPGLPPYLETSLAQAQQEGADALGKWLKTWSRQVQDPRLAWIELDYVVLLNLKNHRDARERFQQVAARIPPGSPVAERIRKLAPAYEQ